LNWNANPKIAIKESSLRIIDRKRIDACRRV